MSIGDPYIKFESAGTISFKFYGNNGTYQYSLDGITWTTPTGDLTRGVTITGGTEIYVRGTGVEGQAVSQGCCKFQNLTSTAGVDIVLSGNIEALVNYEKVANDIHPTLPNNVFWTTFMNCSSLVSVPDLLAINLPLRCYCVMFKNCTNIKKVPKIMATVLGESSLGGLFQGCTSLTEIPDNYLSSVTTINKNSCSYMFDGCSIKKIPVNMFPSVTTLTEGCYNSMFQNCTSLTKVNKNLLPIMNLAKECYKGMFYGCTSLVNTPDLPATTLAVGCYQTMFYGCTSLTEICDLPATAPKDNCYSGMFNGCTALKKLPLISLTTPNANSFMYWMFANCSNIKVSETKEGEYKKSYIIPAGATPGTPKSPGTQYSLRNTGGTYTGDIYFYKEYYTTGEDTPTADYNLYVGVNGKSRKVTKIYVGVNGKAREVTAMYIGVNGKARKV